MSAKAELLQKAKKSAARYCAMGERSPRQVTDKLTKLGLSKDQQAIVVFTLMETGFLNESRFAAAFCNDKLKFNTWGKNRLRMELISHQVSKNVIEDTLASIDDEYYQNQILHLLEKKLSRIPTGDAFLIKKKKLTEFAIRKGFESSLVFSSADQLLSSKRQ